MVPAGDYTDLVLGDLADEAVLVRDPAGPAPLEPVLERLELADPLVAAALDIGDQSVDPLEDLAVLSLPPQVVIPGGLVPDELRSARSRAMPPPCLSRSIEASSRLAFSGLRRRHTPSSPFQLRNRRSN